MKREPGFYWVRVLVHEPVPEPVVGEWVIDGIGRPFWFLPGYAGEYPDHEVTVLSERLTPPV